METKFTLLSIVLGGFLLFTNSTKTYSQAQNYGGDEHGWITMNCQTIDSLEDYQENPTNMEFSKYGGWKAHQTTATGFFRVEKIDGRWWAIDPEGYYYMHKAINSIHLDDITADEVYQLLPQYGFNGTGNWSDGDITDSSLKEDTPLAYCPKRSFMAIYRGVVDNGLEMPVFDDEFEAFCKEEAKYFERFVGDPHVFGYFSDNELSWRDDGLPAHLEITDPSDKNYITAINFLQERGKTADTWDEEDQYAYIALMGERYYSIVSNAIKAVDPDHMYIGSRCHSTEKGVEDFMRNAGKYVDIFSNNHYSKWGAREYELNNMANWSGRPLMMTEFYGMEYDPAVEVIGAGHRVRDQASRGLFYQNFVSTLAENGSIVGWHWFKFQDDGNGNKGVMDVNGNLYTELLDEMEKINTRLYDFIDYVDSRPEPIITLTPEEDAYYQGNNNFNNDELLAKFSSNNSVLREAYIKFDLSSVNTSDISAAKIKLFSISSSSLVSNYQAELVTDDSWDETTITSSNNPDGSTVLATWSAGGDITMDVTDVLMDALNDNDKLSIRVICTLENNKIANFASSEHIDASVHPKLMIYTNDSTLSIASEIYLKNGISTFPNPTEDTFSITSTSTLDITSIRIYSALGRLLQVQDGSLNNVNLKSYADGLYFIEIKSSKGSFIKKVIKKS